MSTTVRKRQPRKLRTPSMAPSRRRSGKTVPEPFVPLQPGFGGGDGSRTFCVILAEAMMAERRVKGIPVWMPFERLPSFRAVGFRDAILAGMKEIGLDSLEALACSSDHDRESVDEIADFLTRHATSASEIEMPPGCHGVSLMWRDVPVLVARGSGVHVLAPGIIARSV